MEDETFLWHHQLNGHEPEQTLKDSEGLDMEQQTSSKLGKEYIKAVYQHLAYLT